MEEDPQARKERIAGVFGRSAPTYGRIGPPFFTHFGRRLVELAQLPRSAAVLDVATGRGAVLFPAVEHVGPQGRAIGIDFAEPMVTETTAELRRRGIPNAEVRLMDAEQPQFASDSFDAILCGFAWFFFPHLDQACSEFRRLLKSGGRIATSTWGRDDERFAWLPELTRVYRRNSPMMVTALNHPSDLKAVLDRAGFVQIQVIEEEAEFVYRDEHEWWATMQSYLGRGALESMPPDALKQYQAEAFARLRPLKQPNGIPEILRVLFALGQKP